MRMKTVLINGGSRGIGAAMVRAFGAAGYTVAFTYFSSDAEAEALARETGALAIKADSASREEIGAAVEKCLTAFGQIDVLINNAAISSFGLFTDMPNDIWDRMLAVNLDGPMQYAKHVLPQMISRKCGKIINISSMWGQVGASCEVEYSTTKAALIGFTKALAKEVGPSGITVNAIAPGVIATEMNARLSEEDLEALKEETPLSRIGTPEEVAAVALFLCGEGGNFMTGQVLSPNGGFVM
ncbi:MAG: SDR family oxidoreductase [Clostridia bacterium]|nr:SDR family oxidoreductase [Clostridia bacterium]